MYMVLCAYTVCAIPANRDPKNFVVSLIVTRFDSGSAEFVCAVNQVCG